MRYLAPFWAMTQSLVIALWLGLLFQTDKWPVWLVLDQQSSMCGRQVTILKSGEHDDGWWEKKVLLWKFHTAVYSSWLCCQHAAISISFQVPVLSSAERKKECEKIGRWYGTDQKTSYICSFSSLCLMDQVSCSMESRCDDRCVAAGREIIFAELFSRVRVTDRVNQSNHELPASKTD